MNSKAARLEESYGASLRIARRRMPHLYRVAKLFEDIDRFRAFCATYASMRWVDDAVDLRQAAREVDVWEEEIAQIFKGQAGNLDFGPALADTLEHFEFSQEPWSRLAGAMRYDIEESGFGSYQTFIDYAEGATVAPASVFATLLLMRPGNPRARPAIPFDHIRDAVRPSAVACYEVHILRDAREDLEAGRNYFPCDELESYRLVKSDSVSESWRPYLRAYAMRTRGGWEPAIADLQRIEGPMTARERLMLHLLVEFYGRSLKKIMRLGCNVWDDVHWPEADEVRTLLAELADRFEPGVDLGALAVRVVEDV